LAWVTGWQASIRHDDRRSRARWNVDGDHKSSIWFSTTDGARELVCADVALSGNHCELRKRPFWKLLARADAVIDHSAPHATCECLDGPSASSRAAARRRCAQKIVVRNARAPPSVAPRIARFIVVSSLDQFWCRHLSALPARRRWGRGLLVAVKVKLACAAGGESADHRVLGLGQLLFVRGRRRQRKNAIVAAAGPQKAMIK